MLHENMSEIGEHTNFVGMRLNVVEEEEGFQVWIRDVEDYRTNKGYLVIGGATPVYACEMCDDNQNKAIYVFDATEDLGTCAAVDMAYCQKHAYGAIAFDLTENGSILDSMI